MVNVAVKKKISKTIEHNISSKINKNVRDVRWRNKYSASRNPYSDLLIHTYCLIKNIKSPVENSINNKIYKHIFSFLKKNKYKRINKYSLRPSLLLLNVLIKRYHNCTLKKCFICYPLYKFIHENNNYLDK